MPVIDLFGETETAEPVTGPVYCEPAHFPHSVTNGLFRCSRCRLWHHDGYTCTAEYHGSDGDCPREWCEECEVCHDSDEDCPHVLIDCQDCESEHERGGDCPREWCSNCDYWHDRDSWGDIECPGWYCDDCETEHNYGEDCPRPYCEDCDGYHEEGECEAGWNCESPRLSFTIRNDGEAPLANDTRATVGLPAGEISAEGLKAIRDYLLQINRRDNPDDAWSGPLYNLAYEVTATDGPLGTKWQTRDGNYTKRLSRHAYKTYGLKLTPEVMSQVGTIARDHSTAVSFDIEVTRDLNQPAEDFANEGSCWWGGMSESRCALKTNGGFGMRSFGPRFWGEAHGVTGRAWVLPLRLAGGQFMPTLDTETPDAFAVFNGYGDLAGYAPARIMALMAGWTYKKMSFSCSPMYINAGCYLVAPEQVIQEHTDGVRLSLSQHADLTNEGELSHAA